MRPWDVCLRLYSGRTRHAGLTVARVISTQRRPVAHPVPLLLISGIGNEPFSPIRSGFLRWSRTRRGLFPRQRLIGPSSLRTCGNPQVLSGSSLCREWPRRQNRSNRDVDDVRCFFDKPPAATGTARARHGKPFSCVRQDGKGPGNGCHFPESGAAGGLVSVWARRGARITSVWV